MSDNYHYEDGAIHHDHKKVLHIDSVNGDDVGRLISAFFKEDAEEAVIWAKNKKKKKGGISSNLKNGITSENVKAMLKAVLGVDENLSAKEAEQSETLWRLLESGRGDRVKIVWQNMVGYLDDRKLFRLKGSPALNKDFFGDDKGYTNIDKGRPSKGLMTADFESIIPLLDAYCPEK